MPYRLLYSDDEKILDFVWIHIVVHALIKIASGSFIRESANIGSLEKDYDSRFARRMVDLSRSISKIEVGGGAGTGSGPASSLIFRTPNAG